jgi:hypothetical protein
MGKDDDDPTAVRNVIDLYEKPGTERKILPIFTPSSTRKSISEK